MPEFTRVGKVGDFPEGRGRAVRHDGRRVAVFRVGGRWFALQDACPHMGASLADGKLDSGCVVCHWHGWKFDLRSGQGDMRSWAVAATYAIKVEAEQVYIGMRTNPEPDPARVREEREQEEWIAWDPDRFFKKKKE